MENRHALLAFQDTSGKPRRGGQDSPDIGLCERLTLCPEPAKSLQWKANSQGFHHFEALIAAPSWPWTTPPSSMHRDAQRAAFSTSSSTLYPTALLGDFLIQQGYPGLPVVPLMESRPGLSRLSNNLNLFLPRPRPSGKGWEEGLEGAK